MEKRAVKQDRKNEIQIDLGTTKVVMEKMERLLYLHLLQLTKGNAHARVASNGTHGVFEAYRHINQRGKNATISSLIERRMKVMKPEAAKTLDDVESKLTAWKDDMRYLREARHKEDEVMLQNDAHMRSILISMIPEAAADHLIDKYDDPSKTLEEMEDVLTEYLME